MSRKLHRPIVEKRGLVVPIKQGGTYGATVAEADINLGLVTTPMRNIPLGIAGLDVDGNILASQIPTNLVLGSLKIDGPSLMFIGTTQTWRITDYDQYSTYTLTAT